MENFTPQQKRKLIKLIELGNNGLPSLLEYLYEIEENTESGFLSVDERFNNLKEYVYELSDEDKQSVLDSVRRSISDRKIANDVLSLISIDYEDIARRASKLITAPKPIPAEKVDYNKIKTEVLNDIIIPTPEKGKDADEVVITSNVVDTLEKKLPIFGEQFRDGLELLQGENRLDKSAIKGIDDYDDLVQFAKSGKGSTQFTAITGIKELIAGTGVTINNTNPQFPIVSSTGGGSQDLQSVTDEGATTTDAITTGGLTTPYVQFDVAATPITNVEGLMQWNITDGTLDLGMDGGDITMQVGQEMFAKVRNMTGVTIPNGTPVYYIGSLGNRPLIAPAQANTEMSGRVTGITTQDIVDNADGFITTVGYVRHIKTNYIGAGIWGTTWVEGDLLYVSKTNAGTLTNVEPSAPHHSDIIGTVGVIGALGTGSILVAPTKHYTLEGLSDVNGTPLATTGQFPVWDNTAGYFDFNYNINDYSIKPNSINTSISIDATGGGYIRGDATAGDITITLITPVTGEIVNVKKVDASTNSVFVYSPLLIDGAEIAELSTESESIQIIYTGVTYDII